MFFYLSLHQKHVMKNRFEAIRVFLPHFFVCLLIIYFFGFNCRLRPAACSALYKEYITGIIVLAAIYLNYLLLFPKLYEQRRFIAYWLCTIGSAVMSGILEMLLVYPQLYERYVMYFDSASIVEALVMDFIYVIIRNGGLILLAYTLNDIGYLRKQEQEKMSLISNLYGFFDVKDSYNKTTLVNIENIYYCYQEKNITNIYTLDGKRYIRYCSLNKMEEMLKPYEFVRVSRDTIVSIPHIIKYANSQVEMQKLPNFTKTVVFQVGDNYVEQVEKTLLQGFDAKSLPCIKNSKKSTEKKRIYRKRNETHQDKTIGEYFEQNPKLMAVYQYIESQPDCKVNDISNTCRLPQGTVRRYIGFLMDKRLIKHTGSRRYGGYSVVGQD